MPVWQIRAALHLAIALCCACAAPAQRTETGVCFLAVSYERDTSLSLRVSEYLEESLSYFMDSSPPVSVLLYTPGQGRATFRYRASCETARRSAQQAFEDLAARASTDVAGELREATWREISQAEAEDAR